MPQSTSPSIPIKLEPQTDKEVIKIVTLYLENFNSMEPSERFAITDAIRYICNPMWKVEGMAAPIEMDWIRKQQKKEVQP